MTEKSTSLDMGAIFIIITLGILWFINSKNINLSSLISVLSGIFLLFPLALLTIFASSNIRKSIQKNYEIERRKIFGEIRAIRKEQEKINDINKLIEMDEEILESRRELTGIQNDRFGKSVIWGLIFFALALSTTYMDIGKYLNINNLSLMIIFFFSGLYNLSKMMKDLLIVFK